MKSTALFSRCKWIVFALATVLLSVSSRADNDGTPGTEKEPAPCPDCPPEGYELASPACSEAKSLAWAMKIGYARQLHAEDLTDYGNKRAPNNGLRGPVGQWAGGPSNRRSDGGGGGKAGKGIRGFGSFGGGGAGGGIAGLSDFDGLIGRYINRGPINRDPVMLEINTPHIGGLTRHSLKLDSTASYVVIRRTRADGLPKPPPETRPNGTAVDANGNEVLPQRLDVPEAIRQIITDTAFADLQDIEGGFHIRLWPIPITPIVYLATTFTDGDPVAVPSGAPIQEAIFKYIDHPEAPTKVELQITTKERFGVSGEHVETEQYIEDGDRLTTTTYLGEDASGQIIKQQIVDHVWRGTKIWDYTIVRQVFERATDADGTYGDLVKIAQTKEEYRDFSPDDYYRRGDGVLTLHAGEELPPEGYSYLLGGKDGYQRLYSIIHDYGDGGKNLKTTYEYELDPNSAGRLKKILYPDGSWVVNDYLTTVGGPAEVTNAYASWKNLKDATSGNPKNYQHGIKSETVAEGTTLTRKVTLDGALLYQTRANKLLKPDGEVVFATERFDGTGWQSEIRTFNPEMAEWYIAGRIKSIRHYDGTLTTYSYQSLGNGEFKVTERNGAGSDAVTAGTETQTIYNRLLQEISVETIDIATSLTLTVKTAELASLDNLGRATKWIYNGDILDYEIERRTCCGVDFTRDRTGATVSYDRDGLRRAYRATSKASSTSPEVVVSTSYSGLVTTRHRSSGGVTLFAGETTKNLASELVSSKEPDQDGDGIAETTLYSTEYLSEGGLREATTYPDGSTRIKTSFRDGKIQSISGTAVPDVTYDYGVFSETWGAGTWTQVTQANGTEWTKIYEDVLNRKIRTEYPSPVGAANVWAYYPVTATAGSVGELSSATDADGVTTSYTYDGEGRLSTITEPLPEARQRVTTITEDVVNDSELGVSTRVVKQLNAPAGPVLSTAFEATDGYASRTETLGVVSKWSQTVPADGSWTTTSIGGDGQKTVKNYAEGRLQKSEFFDNQDQSVSWANWTYDPFDRVLTGTDSRKGTTDYSSYTEFGNLRAATDPGGRTTMWVYDVMGRVIAVDQPDTLDAGGATLANISRTSYHPTGQIAAVWGDQTNATYRTYDEQNRMTGLRTYRGLAHGIEPTSATSGSDATTWIYDPQRGWLTAKRDAYNLGADYSYTAAGRLAARRWARSVSGVRLATEYGYDAGRLADVTYNDGLTLAVAYTYDALGRTNLVTQGGNSWGYAYHATNLQLATETITYDTDFNGTGDFTRVLDRSYDAVLRATGYQLKDGGTADANATYTYDDAGRLGTVGDGVDTFAYGYLANSGNLIHSVTGPAHTVTNTWDTSRDALLVKENKVGTAAVSRYEYTVNAIGQRDSVSRTTDLIDPFTTAWKYNARGEVVSADASTDTNDRFYQYDAMGNRLRSRNGATTDSNPGALSIYYPGALNQYGLITTGPFTNYPHTYDADGNLLYGRLPANVQQSQYKWDAENRMTEAKSNGTTVGTYRYDPFGRRIYKNTSAGGRWFLYDGWNLIAERTSAGDVLKNHLWGQDLSGSMQGAGGVGGLLSTKDPSLSLSKEQYPLYDGNGNVVQYLDLLGSLVSSFEYDAFGAVTAGGVPASGPAFGFSTKYFDAETGLNYYGYRYYDPQQGRWLSRDPITESGGINIYGFSENAAINQYDYLGLKVRNGSTHKCIDEALERLRNSKDKDIRELMEELDKKDHMVNPTGGRSTNKSSFFPATTSITLWNPLGELGFSPDSTLVHELTHARQRQRDGLKDGWEEIDNNKNGIADAEDEATDMQNKRLDEEGKPRRDGYDDRNADPNTKEGPPPLPEGGDPGCDCEKKK